MNTLSDRVEDVVVVVVDAAAAFVFVSLCILRYSERLGLFSSCSV